MVKERQGVGLSINGNAIGAGYVIFEDGKDLHIIE